MAWVHFMMTTAWLMSVHLGPKLHHPIQQKYLLPPLLRHDKQHQLFQDSWTCFTCKTMTSCRIPDLFCHGDCWVQQLEAGNSPHLIPRSAAEKSVQYDIYRGDQAYVQMISMHKFMWFCKHVIKRAYVKLIHVYRSMSSSGFIFSVRSLYSSSSRNGNPLHLYLASDVGSSCQESSNTLPCEIFSKAWREICPRTISVDSINPSLNDWRSSQRLNSSLVCRKWVFCFPVL